jgi:hypothetical protein
LRLNILDSGLGRKSLVIRRRANEIAIGTSKGNLGTTSKCLLLPGGAWSLTPFGGSQFKIVDEDYGGAIMEPGVDYTPAPGMTPGLLFAAPTEAQQPGVAIGPTIIPSGVPGIFKTVPQGPGSPWGVSVLASDAAAWPSPVPVDPDAVPMDRIVVSNTAHRPNMGWFINFESLGGGFSSFDRFLSVLFGGSTEVMPGGNPHAGAWCITFRSSGTATLWEMVKPPSEESPWDQRHVFEWGNPQLVEGRENAVFIVPYASDRLAIMAPNKIVDTITAGSLIEAINAAYHPKLAANRDLRSYYREHKKDGGHVHKHAMSGQGFFRVDSRRDIRKMYAFGRIKYPATGFIVDEPFSVKGPLPAGTPLVAMVDHYFTAVGGLSGALQPAWTGAGHADVRGSIGIQLYDADTHALLSNVLGNPSAYLSVAGQTRYYAKITINASEDRYTCPIFYGYTITVGGTLTPRVGPGFVEMFGLRSKRVTGTFGDPGVENAVVEFNDVRDVAAVARVRDCIRSDLVVVDSTNTLYSRLFEGVTSRPDIAQRSTADAHFQDWYKYPGLRLAGMWHRFGEQVPLDMKEFIQDPSGAVDAEGRPVPWKVVDIIRLLMNDCGVPNDEIMIPTYFDDIRLFPSPKLGEDVYVMQPGGMQPYLKLLNHLIKDYLGTQWCRDPNAGVHGAWRILLPPTSTTTPVLCMFLQRRPAGQPSSHPGFGGTTTGTIRPMVHPSTWGAAATFIDNPEENFTEWVERPEVNYINVVGVGDFGPDGKAVTNVEVDAYNYVSHDFMPGSPTSALVNPLHRDYLGRAVPVYIVDPAIIGLDSAIFVAKRTYDFAAHGRSGARWRAPCVFVSGVDVGQTLPRPLRTWDRVTVQDKDGVMHDTLLKSVDLAYESDRARWAEYEGMYMT